MRISYLLSVLGMLLGATLLGGCAEKYELDKKMEALCKKDGGVNIYETVTLPASDFSENGFPLDRYWGSAKKPEDKLGPDYRYVHSSENIYGENSDAFVGEGGVDRSVDRIYRRSDNKLLGENIEYWRSGGDHYIELLLGMHPSSNHCPKPRNKFLTRIFKKED